MFIRDLRVNFDINDRLVTGLQFYNTLQSIDIFLNRGISNDSLKSVGNKPLTSDSLKTFVMWGTMIYYLRHISSSHL